VRAAQTAEPTQTSRVSFNGATLNIFVEVIVS
jgi:hypothetical protein